MSASKLQQMSQLWIKVFLAFSWVLVMLAGFPSNHAQAASITVNSTADTTTPSDSQCTLREAIANANTNSDTTAGDCTAGSGTDTITFTAGALGQTITLAGTQLLLTSSIIIDATPSGVTVNANGVSRVFQINAGNTVVLTKLSIINGNVTGAGGGISNSGTLTINDSLVTGNTGTTFGGGIVNGTGGALSVNRTTIRNNSIVSTGGAQAGGAGISNTGTMILNNTTISNNSVTGTATNRNGGGIRNPTGATATLNNVTIAENHAGSNGGGISDAAAFTMNNTLVANNTAGSSGPDCRGSVNANFTLIESISTCTITGGNNITNSDPILGPLDANGGGTISHPMLTYFPMDSSPALNTGNNATCLATDQRGNPRPVGTCDIGSVEKQTGEQTDQHCTWSSGVPHVFGTDVNVTITPNTTDNPGCITVLKRPVFAGLSQESGEFPNLWTLTATNSIYNLDIDFCYTDPELATAGVSDENSIVIFHLQNGVWQATTTTTSPSTNCVSVSGVTTLSPWTIVGNGNSPTVIELQNLTAQAVNSPQSLTLAVVALSGLVLGLILLRSRK